MLLFASAQALQTVPVTGAAVDQCVSDFPAYSEACLVLESALEEQPSWQLEQEVQVRLRVLVPELAEVVEPLASEAPETSQRSWAMITSLTYPAVPVEHYALLSLLLQS